ncbi:MAG: DUF1801 domain-containing protein [Ilumatobacteraceae bacterium]
MATKFTSVDDYIAAAAADVRPVLEDILRTMHEVVPGAGETIKYDMPTLTLDGRSVVHVAAWKHHIGLYPLPAGDPALAAELAPYDTGKGTARFPLDQPIPVELIGRITAALAQRQTAADVTP